MRNFIHATLLPLIIDRVAGQWFPQAARVHEDVLSVSPEWLSTNTQSTIVVRTMSGDLGNMPIEGIDIRVVGPTTTTLIRQEFSLNNPFTFDLPPLSEAGEFCVEVDAEITPINGRTRQRVRFGGGKNCFIAIPPITWVSTFSVVRGPPTGGSILSFTFNMDQPWPVSGSPPYELDCVFDEFRVPVIYSFPASPGSPIQATCTTPTILSRNFDVCVNLVPRDTKLVIYPTLQDPTWFSCAGNTIPFNYYPQIPEPAETLDPEYINYDGISDPVVVRVSFPPSPQSMGPILCRYGPDSPSAVIVSGTFNSVDSTVSCDGAPEGDLAQLVIDPITSYLTASIFLSFNDGVDWTPRAAVAHYNTEYYIDYVDPPVIPYSGGTPIRFYIFYDGQKIDPVTNTITRPKLFTDVPVVVCLFYDVAEEAVSIPITPDATGDFMFGITQPVETAFQVADRSLLTDTEQIVIVSFFLPGTTDCQDPVEDGKALIYRPDWQGASVTPSVFTINPPTTPLVFNVVGENFYSTAGSSCRIRPVLPPGSNAAAVYEAGSCDLFGTFSQVAADGTAGSCTVSGKETLLWCVYDAVRAGSAETSSEAFLEYTSLLVEISIANNGADYIPLVQRDASSGASAPLLVSAIRVPTVERLIPDFGFTFGGYSIEVQLRSGVSWDVTKCVFHEISSGISKSVDANIFTLRSVGCVVPQWRLLPGVTSTQFTVTLEISDNQFTSPQTFTMYEFPTMESAFPRVGPISGGTEISIVADTDSLDLFLNPSIRSANFPTPLSVQCVFESIVSVPAFYDPATGKLGCTAPPATKVGLGAGGYATVDLNVNWLQGSDDTTTMNDRLRFQSTVSVYQFVFVYQPMEFQVSSIYPLSGPTDGGTLVIIETVPSSSIPNTGFIHCLFGRIAILADRRDANTIWCTSPEVANVGIVALKLSINGGQTTTPFLFTTAIGNATAGTSGSMYFSYYNRPTVSILSPPSGSTLGGTNVIVHGNNFSGTEFDNPKCRFGTRIVDVVLFMSSKILVCTSPPATIGRVPISVSNNGIDFAPVSDSSAFFTYTEVDAIVMMSPILGPITGGTKVIISARTGTLPTAASKGYIFDSSNPPRCAFGGYSVIGTILNSDGDIQCTSPEVPSSVTLNVIVYFDSQQAAYVAESFLFYDVPSISSVDPPLGPEGVPNTLTLRGQNFMNSKTLKVRFGTVNVGHIDVAGLYVSPTEIRVSAPIMSPSSITRRLPVMISNNGVDFVPIAIEQWDPNNESLNNIVKYYTLHIPVSLRFVHPPFANMHGGGYVSVYGGPFINTGGLGSCSFDSIVSSAGSPIFISPDHILCPVPNMWVSGSPSALSRTAKLQISLVGSFFSPQFLNFRFISDAPPGAYLPHTSPSVFTSVVARCLPGHACEVEGLTQPIQCAPGTYQSYPNQKSCLPCPIGFYCPTARSTRPLLCDPGWVCDMPGLVSPTKICPPGFICLSGTASTDLIPDEPLNSLTPSSDAFGTNGAYRCPLGMYCAGGVVSFVSKPGNFSTPQPCFPGAYCSPGSSTPYGSGLVPLGKFSAAPNNPGRLCPPRYYCGPVTGNVNPTACRAGTFNALPGQHNCTLSPEGSIAPAPMMARPIPAPCGMVAGRKGMIAVGVDDLCPPGMRCGHGVAADAEPPICFKLTTTNTEEINNLCQAAFNQVYIPGVATATWNRVDKTKGQCCWDTTKVKDLATRIVNIFKASAYSNPLLARGAQGFSDKLSANPMNGLELLESVNRDSLISVYSVNIGKVRERILFEIERQYSFTLPEACATGSFCGAGTCAEIPVVLTQPKA